MINDDDSNSNALELAGRNTAFDTSAIVYRYGRAIATSRWYGDSE